MGPSSFLLLALSSTLLLSAHSWSPHSSWLDLSPSPSPSPSPSAPSSGDSSFITDTNFQFDEISAFQTEKAVESPNPPVAQTCSKTPEPTLCVSQVQSAAPGLTNAAPRDVLDKTLDTVIFAIRAVEKKAATLPAQFSPTAAQPTDDPDMAGHPDQMSVCVDKLGEALDDINEIKNSLPASDVESMQSHFDSSSDAVSTCAELDTPLKEDMATVEKMFLNCRGVFDSIWVMASNKYLFG